MVAEKSVESSVLLASDGGVSASGQWLRRAVSCLLFLFIGQIEKERCTGERHFRIKRQAAQTDPPVD